MKSSLPSPFVLTSEYAALSEWYSAQHAVRCLWAIKPVTGHRPRILLAIDPTPDGDETLPRWIAKQHAWSRELRVCMGNDVDLELVDAPASDSFDTVGSGTLLAAFCWREPAVDAP